MVFNSIPFLFFLIIVFFLFWIIPIKYRWILLLISSIYFYMYWNPIYILLLLASTLNVFYNAKYLISSKNKKIKKTGIILSVTLDLLILITFKYYNFFNDILAFVLKEINFEYVPSKLNLILPIGISFYTFQTLSYAIDVYKNKIKPETNLARFTLFVTFFPQLVAGPIERFGHLNPQLKKKKIFFNLDNIKKGCVYILWGIFMKVVIADNISTIIERFYENPEIYDGGTLFYATILFTFQIYTDFAGYSSIAIGTALLFDIKLTRNFISPYQSQNITEFWKRWHISLSIWVRDYIYIPLGGSKKGQIRTYVNLFITLLIVGLWHGASINFILWGVFHALLLIFERIIGLSKLSNNKLMSIIRKLITFVIITLTMVPVRSLTFSNTILIYRKIFNFDLNSLIFWFKDNIIESATLGIFILVLTELILKKKDIDYILKTNVFFRYGFYLILLFLILLIGKDQGAEFIYFNF
jgi:alginate O-acetyltransferase complex protein AlgI